MLTGQENLELVGRLYHLSPGERGSGPDGQFQLAPRAPEAAPLLEWRRRLMRLLGRKRSTGPPGRAAKRLTSIILAL